VSISAKQIIWAFYKFGAIAFLFYYLFYKFNWNGVLDLLPSVNIVFLLASGIGFFLKLCVDAFKWWILNKAFKIHLGYWLLFRYKLSGLAFDFITPVPQGEDVFKFMMLKKASASNMASSAIPVLAKFSGLMAVASLMPLTIVTFKSLLLLPQYLTNFGKINFTAVFLLSVVSLFVFIKFVVWLQPFHFFYCQSFLRLQKAAVDLLEVLRSNVILLMISLLVSFIVHLCYCLVIYNLVKSLAVDISLLKIIACLPLIYFAALLPFTPGGIGMKEGVILVLLISNGVSKETAQAVVILHLLLHLFFLVPGFIFILLEKFK